mgnify:CR=1 FL=1
MRNMIKGATCLKVTEHIIIKNLWEYYVCDAPTNTLDVKLCLVVGDETELGDVYLPEIKPFVVMRTSDLTEVMAAPGWFWEKPTD